MWAEWFAYGDHCSGGERGRFRRKLSEMTLFSNNVGFVERWLAKVVVG